MTDFGSDPFLATDSASQDAEEPPEVLIFTPPRDDVHVLVFYVHDRVDRFLSPDDVRVGREVKKLWESQAFDYVYVVGDSRLPDAETERGLVSIGTSWMGQAGVPRDRLFLPTLARKEGFVETAKRSAEALRHMMHQRKVKRYRVTLVGMRQDVRDLDWVFSRYRIDCNLYHVPLQGRGVKESLSMAWRGFTLRFFEPVPMLPHALTTRRRPRRKRQVQGGKKLYKPGKTKTSSNVRRRI